MLLKVEATDPDANPFGVFGAILKMNIHGASNDPIQIRDIQGLGPVKATISSTPYGDFDGEYLTGSSTGKRNIVLILGFNPNWATQTMESLRENLYRYFMPKAKTRLRFFSDDREIVEITGFVESFEPNIFSKDPSIQVSIICPEPDFIGYFGNAHALTGNVDLIDSHVISIDYAGSVPAGFEFRLLPTGANYTGPVTLFNKPEFGVEKSFAIPSVTLEDLDEPYLELSTKKGSKYVRLHYNDTDELVSLMGSISTDSTWLTLVPGLNLFRINADDEDLGWVIEYFNHYGGI